MSFITNVKGYCKFEGEPGLDEFYNKDLNDTMDINREYLQLIMDEHTNITEIGYKQSKVTLYRFEVIVTFKGKVKKFKKSAFFRVDKNWKVLGRSVKTFTE